MTKDVKGTKEPKDVYHFSAVDSIERLPLSEQVYVTLKQAILTGELLPQEKLNEVKIAEQLKVSATPVREAFRKLAKDNLVVIVPWKGVTVKADTPEEIVALYQCRAENAMREHINNAFIFKRANAELQDKKLNEV